MDWKIIGLGALVNGVLTVVLSLIFFPISFLGPIIGGFIASYLTERFEDYDTMDEKDGAVVGAISGFIGALITTLFFILGFGDISAITGLTSSFGIENILLKGYIILQLSVIIGVILGLVGGVIGVFVKK